MKALLRWELNDHFKVSILALSLPILVLVLSSEYLSKGGFFSYSYGGSIIGASQNQISIPKSPTGKAIIQVIGVSNVWTLLSFVVPILSVIAFRFDRENNYAQPIFSLPLSKRNIFAVKTFSVLLYSLILLYLPVFLTIAVVFADVPGLLSTLFKWPDFRHVLILGFYFILYSVAVSILFSTLLPNSSQTIMASLTTLFVPYFIGLDLPPYSFPKAILTRELSNVFAMKYIISGIVVPALLLLISMELIEWRDVT